MKDTKDPANEGNSSVPEGVWVQVFGRTDVGMVRDHNEDNFLIADLSTGNRSIQPEVQNHRVGKHGTLFAVCDGMGGAAAGEVASKIAVDTIYEMLQSEPEPVDERELSRRLDEAISEAGKRIHNAAKSNASQRGMGTTATVTVLMGNRLLFGQIGDSRAYLFRNGRLVQTTKDQSLVQQLIDANQLTEEEAKNFDRSNIILQALGTSDEVTVDITSAVLRRGDVLVMCSDGLSGMVDSVDIQNVIMSMESPMQACQALTSKACDNGGDDNVTVIVARFDGDGLALPVESDAELKYEKFVDEEHRLDGVDTPTVRGGPALIAAAVRANSGNRSSRDEKRSADPKTDSGGKLKLVFSVLVALVLLGGIAVIMVLSGSETPSGKESPVNLVPHVVEVPDASQEASSKVPSDVTDTHSVSAIEGPDSGDTLSAPGSDDSPDQTDSVVAENELPDDTRSSDPPRVVTEPGWPTRSPGRRLESGSSVPRGTVPETATKKTSEPSVGGLAENPY